MSSLKSRIASVIVSPRLAAARRKAVDWAARLRNEPPTLTLYYQPGDAYSHLCAQLIPQLRDRLNAEMRVVVIPTVASAANAAPELFPAYALLDATRIAPAWGLNLNTEAQAPGAEVREAAERILLSARDLDAFLDLEASVAKAMWANNAAALGALPAVDAQRAKQQLDNNDAELRKRGHYQGGMWHFRGDWYWALDRLHYLERRLRNAGLVRGDQPLAELTPSAACLPPLNNPKELRLFYSFRSPYSYIAAARSAALAEQYGVELDIRPVLPMVMRGLKVPQSKRLYIVRDSKREADRLGVPFGRIADPLGGGVERCLAVFPHAQAYDKALAFLVEAGHAIWGRGEEIKRKSVLHSVLQRAGLDPALAELAPCSGVDLGYAEANREKLFGVGLWGVPSYQLGDLAVWGQDRLWLLEEALRRAHFTR